MMPEATAEEILKESRDVILTNGEWEIADITVAPINLTLAEGSYSEITYYVSTFKYHDYSMITYFELQFLNFRTSTLHTNYMQCRLIWFTLFAVSIEDKTLLNCFNGMWLFQRSIKLQLKNDTGN